MKPAIEADQTVVDSQEQQAIGYVYILEVCDIMLPVCKIGRTQRDPSKRCDEINTSSTGDFLWKVFHCWAVNDCISFERLIHKKLQPLRQKRREFFNLNPEDAVSAVQSILDGQSAVEVVTTLPSPTDFSNEARSEGRQASKKSRPRQSSIVSKYTDLMFSFTSILGVTGRPFGQLSRPSFGVSDGSEGVQWNLYIFRETEEVRLGVNLEGMAYDGWQIANLLLHEQSARSLLQIREGIRYPEDIRVSFMRDAWLPSGRLTIQESHLGDQLFWLSDLTEHKWEKVIEEGLGCLNKARGYRGRTKQLVTHAKDGRQSEKWVSPHLNISTAIELKDDEISALQDGFDKLTPIYEWAKSKSQP